MQSSWEGDTGAKAHIIAAMLPPVIKYCDSLHASKLTLSRWQSLVVEAVVDISEKKSHAVQGQDLEPCAVL